MIASRRRSAAACERTNERTYKLSVDQASTSTSAAMRGAAGARKALLARGGNACVIGQQECFPAARGEGDWDGDGDGAGAREGNPTVVERGSCSRSGTACRSCDGRKDVSAEGGAVVGKDPRWGEGGVQSAEGVRRGPESRAAASAAAATTSSSAAGGVGVAGTPFFSSSTEMMKPAKVDERTMIGSEDVGVHESTLAKLKRKIRLKLLAEEARNSQPSTAGEAQEYGSHGGAHEKRATEDDGGPSSSSRVVITEDPNPSYPLRQQHHHSKLHLQQQLSHVSKQPLENNGSHTGTQGRIVVDLSSDDEAGVSNPSRFQQQQQQKKKNCKHLTQTASPAPKGAASAVLLRPKEEDEAYSSILERLLRPLIVAAMDQSTRTAPKKSKTSNKPLTSKVKVELIDELADLLDLGRGKNSSRPGAASARREKGGPPSLDDMLNQTPPKKRGRPKKVSLEQPTSTAPVKKFKSAQEEGVCRISDPLPNLYELERENNILRNRAFLQGLLFNGPQHESRAAETPPVPVVLEAPNRGWEDEDGDINVRNNDLHSEHRVESQRSQITSALSGTSSAIQRSGKTPVIDDNYDDECLQEENDDNSAKSSKLSTMQGKTGKPLQNGKEKAPRGRPRKVKPCDTTCKETALSKQELMKILAELLSSRSEDNSIPPNLLQRLESSSNGGQSEQTVRRGRPKKKPTEVLGQPKEKQKAESTPPPPRKSVSPTSTSRSAWSEGKKRKDTSFPTIPFETPTTDYEIHRNQAIRDRKDHLAKMAAAAGTMGDSNAPPRQTRPYHKRWTSLNPDYNRQTRLRDRLSTARNDTLAAVKKETLEADDVETLSELRADPSFADSLVAKFSNWNSLQKQRPAAPSRKWDLNEPSMSSTMGSRVLNFEAREEREQLIDPLLARIYTMDVAAVKGEYNGLLAAGGSQGRIAVFALKALESWSSYGRARLDAFSDEDEARVPILAWSIDSSWISQVIFLPSQFKEKQMLLLSSSNDGRVVLWDVNRVRVKKGARELNQEGMPRVVCQTTTLHSGSIFGMHEMEARMATASEDGVGVSVIRETMIFMERCVTGHHSGVIRSVRFRDKNVLADCGAEMEIGILDLRCPQPCTLKLATEHQTPMSMVEWSPASDNVLLSASLDPQLYLHDIRSPGERFVHKLDRHVHPRRLKCYSVYRPAFVDGGQAVASPGEATHQLALYAVDTGSTVAKVNLGFDATIVHWSGLVPSADGGLWAGSNAVTFCKPVWPQSGSSQFDVHDRELLPPPGSGAVSPFDMYDHELLPPPPGSSADSQFDVHELLPPPGSSAVSQCEIHAQELLPQPGSSAVSPFDTRGQELLEPSSPHSHADGALEAGDALSAPCIVEPLCD